MGNWGGVFDLSKTKLSRCNMVKTMTRIFVMSLEEIPEDNSLHRNMWTQTKAKGIFLLYFGWQWRVKINWF